MFFGVLFQGLQAVRFPPVLVSVDVKELLRLFALFKHICGWETQHFYDPAHLVVLGRPREKRQAEEEFDGDASKGPHVNGRIIRQSEQHLG